MNNKKSKEFIEKANIKYDNKYDYSKVDYVRSKVEVTIICPEHGEFEQTPNRHLSQKYGCRKCALLLRSQAKTHNNVKVIKQFKAVHGNKYDYSKVEYINNRAEVTIICPKHGEFEQKPVYHKQGQGCSECNEATRVAKRRTPNDEVLKRFRAVHGDKYDYSKMQYVNKDTNITIICPEHGEFDKRPSEHTLGTGCLVCSGNERYTTNSFIAKAFKEHGDKYDYSKVNVNSANDIVTIICPEHGKFEQQAGQHCRGGGCIKCAGQYSPTTGEWITKAQAVHGDRYDYSLVEYVNQKTKVKIICPVHGMFEQLSQSHIDLKCGCKDCSSIVSYKEKELADYIKSLGVNVDTSNRSLIAPYELDVVCHDQKVAFEFNGLYWHTEEQGKGVRYHLGKTMATNKKGYRLIHIFEDDWDNNTDRLKSFIAHTLGKNTGRKVYARNCDLEVISKDEAKPFLEKHHIQGFAGGIFIALIYNDEIVSVTTFTKGRSNTKNKDMYELSRHATSDIVIGALGKATKFFASLWTNKIYTFCDTSMFNGISYEKAGYVAVSEIEPDYKYVVGNKREHKFNWRLKDIYKKYPQCEGMTERKAMSGLGFGRIWDCGKVRYEYQP